MTSPAVDTGIVAFIEARLDERDLANEMFRSAGAGDYLARRVLAEVAKDRAILALHRPDTMMSGQTVCGVCCADDEQKWTIVPAQYTCQTVRLLAAIDADHPDYDPSWKPVAG